MFGRNRCLVDGDERDSRSNETKPHEVGHLIDPISDPAAGAGFVCVDYGPLGRSQLFPPQRIPIGEGSFLQHHIGGAPARAPVGPLQLAANLAAQFVRKIDKALSLVEGAGWIIKSFATPELRNEPLKRPRFVERTAAVELNPQRDLKPERGYP